MRNFIESTYIMYLTEKTMNILLNFIQKCLFFEKEPQKIGLCQLKNEPVVLKKEPSIKNKDVKLSDLMRRAS